MRNKLFSRIETIYQLVNNEENARVCKEISEEACRYTPLNFFLLLISKALTQLGDVLSKPKTVLAWLMSFVGAPVYLISLIVPIRESGSMMPQILIAASYSTEGAILLLSILGVLGAFVSKRLPETES